MDYPSNSREQKKPVGKPEEPKKVVEQVISGKVIRKKKSVGKRFSEMFGGGDSRSVGSYVFLEVLIPAAKDAIADAFSQGVEKMLFGEARSTSRRNPRYYGPSSSGGHTQYNRPGILNPRRDDPRHDPSRRARATHNFDDIILQTRMEAEQVIERLFDLVNRYDQATVADLYDMLGATSEYTDNKYGWTDIRGADFKRVRNGYLLDLPRPVPLD
jgi:hypothetical protein